MKAKQMPESMAEFSVNMQHPNQVLISGLYVEHVKVGETSRPFYTYIPEKLEYCSPCLIVAIPEDAQPEIFLEEAGLNRFADAHQLFLFLAVAKDGKWMNDGSDAAYLNAMYVAVQARDYYITMQDNIYLCGLSSAACAAQQAAVQMASEWSGLITMGDLTDEIDFNHKTAEAKEQGEVELAVQASQAQLPVWMLISHRNDRNEAAIAFWRHQNGTTQEEFSGAGCDQIWMPSALREFNEINTEKTSEVRVKIGDTTLQMENLELAWDFAKRTRRHRGVGGKSLRNYKDPIACGATRHELEVDGMVRTWYEYVPKACTPDKKWPVVVVMHGRGGSAETFFDLSGMSLVAEERKFIALFPEASIHQQKKGGLKNVLLWCGIYEDKPINDVTFIRAMLRDVEDRLPVNPRRRYACGQSSGGMMSDVLGYNACDLFAAVAPWSALRTVKRMFGSYEKGAYYTPTFFLYGDKDFLCTGPDMNSSRPFPISDELWDVIDDKLQDLNLEMNDCTSWETYPITWYSYNNAQGVPLLVVGNVNNMVHANYPEESWISYDQFLSRFERDEDGTLYYCGKKVAVR